MTFLAPAALAGLAAVSIPVAIHLLNKFRVKEVRWAAMAFLAAAVTKNQRRIKLADLLLLLLRCALVVLIALAFARPTFENPNEGAGSAGGSRKIMVLLDDSGSMGQSDGVETRFEAARSAALKYLENLSADSSAGLLLVSDTVTPSVPRPSTNLALVRRSVELARLSDRGSDFLPAIRQAYEVLKPLSGAREIVFFTDNQELGWTQLDTIRSLVAANPAITLRIKPIGAAGEPNLAITGIDLEGVWPAPNTPVRVMVEVTNHTATPVNGVRITLAVDDQSASAETIIDQLAPEGTRRFPLLVQFSGPGVHLLTATLPPDRLAMDNQRVLAVRVAQPRSTLIVETRRQAAGPLVGTGIFLSQSLAPVDPSEAETYYLHPVTMTASQVTAEDLKNYDVVFLCDAEPLNAEVLAALPGFVKRGGGLVLFPGTATPASDYANAPWKDLLPGIPGSPGEGLFTWEAPPYPNPLLSLWNDPANGSLRAVKITRLCPLVRSDSSSPDAGEASVVLRLTTREPAIMERRFGLGHVVIFNTNPSPGWTNFPLHPAFVAFVHRLYAYVTPRPVERLNLVPGETFHHDLDIEQAKKEVFLSPPLTKGTPVSVGRTELHEGKASLRITDTETAGGYRVYLDRSGPPTLAFAVQPPAAESNLKTATPDLLTRPTSSAPGAADSATSAASNPGWRPSTAQLWLSITILVLIVSVAELMLALRSTRAAA